MFIHVIVDNCSSEVVSVNAVKQADVLDALSSTPKGKVSYVLNADEDLKYIKELRSYDYEEVYEQLEMSEEEGNLVAKYDNDVLEYRYS